MLTNGYIKEYRSLLSWGWFKDPFTAHLWQYLRLAANWDESIFKGEPVHRGELVTSYPAMAEATGMSVQNVRTAVRHLKKTGEITMRSYRDFSVITVVNYDKYQSDDSSEADRPADNLPKPAKCPPKPKEPKPEKPKEPDWAERFNEPVRSAVADWLKYKTERREAYKPTGLKSLLTEIENRVKKHGEQAVDEVIRLSMASNWKGIIWDKIGEKSKKETEGAFGGWGSEQAEKDWIARVQAHKHSGQAEQNAPAANAWEEIWQKQKQEIRKRMVEAEANGEICNQGPAAGTE